MLAIVGPHRSGTSLVARWLQGCGLSFGEPATLLPGDRWNPHGYFEHRDVLDLNQWLLTGYDYTSGPVTRAVGRCVYICQPSERVVAQRFERRRADMMELAETLAHNGIKDPRLCLLWPLWHSLRRFEGVVICLRHPILCALSMQKRYRLPISIALRFWRWHAEGILRGLPQLRTERGCVWLDYSRLTKGQPEKEFSAIASFLSLPNVAVAAEALEVALDSSLAGSMATRIPLPAGVQRVWQGLLAAAGSMASSEVLL